MKKWLKRISDATAMGLIWAAQWAVLAVLIGTITESLYGYSIEKNHLDPLMALAMPGFIVGVIFSTVLWFAEGGRRIDELSLPRLAKWGAVVGLLMGVLSFVLGTPSDRFPLWLGIVIIIGSSTVLSIFSAVGSGLLFRHKIPVHVGPKRYTTNMNKNFKPNIAIKLVLSLIILVTIFHLGILLKIIPYEITWGGRLENDSEMYVFETISIIVNLILVFALLIKGKYIKQMIPDKVINLILWIFVILFGLNTIGNIFAETNFEKSFSILTILLSILIWIIIKSKNEKETRI